MNRLIVFAILSLVLLGGFGCAKPEPKTTKIKCPACGVEFEIGNGLTPAEQRSR